MQGWHVWLLIELLPSVCKVLGSILSTGTGGTGQETTQQLSGHSYLKSKAQAILRGHVEGGECWLFLTKSPSFDLLVKTQELDAGVKPC